MVTSTENVEESTKIKKTKFFYGKELKLEQWLPIITETSNIQRRMDIPQVLDENQSLFLILTRSSMSSAKFTNNNRNVKNPV